MSPDYPFKIFGLKLTKSEPFVSSKGELIWDGVNKKLLLGQFKDRFVAFHFAENVKNGTEKKHWKISVENENINLLEEIGYTIKEDYRGNKIQQFRYQK